MSNDIALAIPRVELGQRAEAREKEAERFLKLGAEWLFTCDSDQTIPVEAFAYFIDWAEQKVSPQADIYVIDAPSKGLDDSNVFYHPDGSLAHFTISCCLIHKSVFERLERPWFSSKWMYREAGKKDGRIIWDVQEKMYDDNINEDVYFSRKCLEAGIRVEVIPKIKSRHMEIWEKRATQEETAFGMFLSSFQGKSTSAEHCQVRSAAFTSTTTKPIIGF